MKVNEPACTVMRHTVSKKNLPLCCPMTDQRLWDAHPRVYLPIEEAGGFAVCPYCETEYSLVAD